MIDSSDDMLPVVDVQGNIIGAATRRECHEGGKLLHPVVHLHVFNSKGELYLQKRPRWKDIQPGKWDTSCGGHVGLGENVGQALRREVKEELGIEDYKAEFIADYIFESTCGRELVYVFRTVYDRPLRPDAEELDGGRFWSRKEIGDNVGKGVFTPNFEDEYKKYIKKT